MLVRVIQSYTCLFISIFCSSDVDQCLTNNGGCAHTCTNELPGFTCSCRTGYNLDTDNKGCVGESRLLRKFPFYRFLFQILTSVQAVPVETSVSTLMAVFIASVPPTLLWTLMVEVAYVRSIKFIINDCKMRNMDGTTDMSMKDK